MNARFFRTLVCVVLAATLLFAIAGVISAQEGPRQSGSLNDAPVVDFWEFVRRQYVAIFEAREAAIVAPAAATWLADRQQYDPSYEARLLRDQAANTWLADRQQYDPGYEASVWMNVAPEANAWPADRQQYDPGYEARVQRPSIPQANVPRAGFTFR